MQELQQLAQSKRQRKNEETRQKLMQAMASIMQKYDYNTVTIRNICSVSGVSTGSFYNLFENKEAFLRYYLTNDFTQYMEQYYTQHPEFEELDALEKSVDIFVCCARYNVEKGIRFISGFYVPNNHSLYTDIHEPEKEYSFTPLLTMARTYLHQAIQQGILSDEFPVETTINTYCYLFNGITFNWCISQGKLDMIGQTQKVLRYYLKACQTTE